MSSPYGLTGNEDNACGFDRRRSTGHPREGHGIQRRSVARFIRLGLHSHERAFRVYSSGKFFTSTQALKFDRYQDRRRIEREAFSGQLLGIIATNALELGVDIGALDVVIVLGFPPGGLASFVRRSSRSAYNSV